MAQAKQAKVNERYRHLLELPVVPEDARPRMLYLNDDPGAHLAKTLTRQGYQLVDVRILPNRTDHDRAELVKAYLDGVRMGTLEADAELLSYLRLESQIYGLVGSKDFGHAASKEKKGKLEDEDLGTILGFGRRHVVAPPEVEKED